ncbi:MAG TPA: hypothetical protein PK680_08760 [Novosphingobium sp.]|nr:hypothetical protein [Novosphingobium sp.]HQA18457.1 hypothetical protein [Novosphingobium sp.]
MDVNHKHGVTQSAKAGFGAAFGSMFGKFFGCLGILIVLSVMVAMCSPSSKDDKSSGASSDASAPPIEVTARELAAAYEENEAGAQLKYGKSPLIVTAVIQSIDLGLGDKPFLVLRGTNEFMGPQAQLDEAGQTQAANLKKGQKIKLRCAKVSEVVGTPMLNDCAILP